MSAQDRDKDITVQLDDIVAQLRSSTGTLFGTLVVIACVAMYGWLVAPHVNYIKAVERYGPVVKTLVEEKMNLQESLVRRREMLDNFSQKFSEIQGMLYTSDQARTFFVEMDHMVSASNCYIEEARQLTSMSDTVKSDDEDEDPVFVDTIQARFSIIGYCDGLTTLLQRIRNAEHKIWIDTVDILVVNVDIGLLRCDLNVTIFVFRDKEAALNG